MEAGARQTKINGAADATPATAGVSQYERLPLLRDLQRRWSRSAGLQRMLAPPIYAFLFRRRSRPLVRMAEHSHAAAPVVAGRIVRAQSAASAPESEPVEVTDGLTAVFRQAAPAGTAHAVDSRDDELSIVQGNPGSAGAVHLARAPGVDRAAESDPDEITSGRTAVSLHKVSPESRVGPQSEAAPGSGDIAPARIQTAAVQTKPPAPFHHGDSLRSRQDAVIHSPDPAPRISQPPATSAGLDRTHAGTRELLRLSDPSERSGDTRQINPSLSSASRGEAPAAAHRESRRPPDEWTRAHEEMAGVNVSPALETSPSVPADPAPGSVTFPAPPPVHQMARSVRRATESPGDPSRRSVAGVIPERVAAAGSTDLNPARTSDPVAPAERRTEQIASDPGPGIAMRLQRRFGTFASVPAESVPASLPFSAPLPVHQTDLKPARTSGPAVSAEQRTEQFASDRRPDIAMRLQRHVVSNLQSSAGSGASDPNAMEQAFREGDVVTADAATRAPIGALPIHRRTTMNSQAESHDGGQARERPGAVLRDTPVVAANGSEMIQVHGGDGRVGTTHGTTGVSSVSHDAPASRLRGAESGTLAATPGPHRVKHTMQRAIVQQTFSPKAEPIPAGDVVRGPGPARQSPANSFIESGNFIAHRIQRRSEEPMDAGADEIGAAESRAPLNVPAPVPVFRVSGQVPNMPVADSVAASLLSGATQQGHAFPGLIDAARGTPSAPTNFTPISVLRRKPLAPGSQAVPGVELQTMLSGSSLFRVSSSRVDRDSAPALVHAARPEMVSRTPLGGLPSVFPGETGAGALQRSSRVSVVPAIHTSISSVYREPVTSGASPSYPGAAFAPAPPPVPYARAPESEIRKLAEQVYQLITRRLASERERRGLS